MNWTILECPVGPGKTQADFLSYSDFHGSWISGVRMADPPPDPIELTWDPMREDGLRKAYYESSVVLMAKGLVLALREAGVDNLDTYPVIVRSTKNGDICGDYVAVNVIGSIAAADMEKSVVLDEGAGMVDVIFSSLVIDENKARGQLFFRLAESAGALVVHEPVRDHLLRKGGFGLTFTEPRDYCG